MLQDPKFWDSLLQTYVARIKIHFVFSLGLVIVAILMALMCLVMMITLSRFPHHWPSLGESTGNREENPPVNSQSASHVDLSYFQCSEADQAVERTAGLWMIWDVLVLIRHHCNAQSLTGVFVHDCSRVWWIAGWWIGANLKYALNVCLTDDVPEMSYIHIWSVSLRRINQTSFDFLVRIMHHIYMICHGPLARYAKLRVRMRRKCWERFPRHRRWAISTCITARASRTCRDACRDR